ncbi:MAG: hypothetical protein QOF95_200 [Pseudonocardiales bacterium]|nr:hypothetical protein [Pseudonocardiales bacterium]
MRRPRVRSPYAAGALVRPSRWMLVSALMALAVPAVGANAAPTPAPTGAGSIGLSLLDDAGTAGEDPRARVYIVDHAGPGGVVHRRVELANNTAGTAHIVLYAAGATIERGTFVGAADRTRNDVSTWTSVLPSATDLPAGGHALADVTIRVARDAAPGEHYGVVWAEVRSASSGSGGVIEVSRVGIRIYLSVGPGAPPAAGFTVGSLSGARSSAGDQLVTASVHNTGGRALDMVGTLQLLAGPGGVRAGPFPVTLGTTVAVGDSEPVTIALAERLPAGPWTAQLVLRSGLVERTTQATITFPGKAKSPTGGSNSTGIGWLSAGILAVAVLLGIAAVIVLARRRRRRRSPRPTQDDSAEALPAR